MNPEVKLAAAKTTKVAVATLTTSEAMQPRRRVNLDAIQRYRTIYKTSATPPFPPIVVARLTDQPEDQGRLMVVDGFHRVAAARAAGVKKIAAQIVEVSLVEAEWLAVKLNGSHGLPLSKSDHVEAFNRFMRAGMNVTEGGGLLSYREIAAGLGGIRSHQTFANWMAKRFPDVAAAMAGRDPEQIEEPDDMGDTAKFLEDRLRYHTETACKIATEMRKAQGVAVERSPKNSGMSGGEKTRRATARTQAVLLQELDALLTAVGQAVGMSEKAMLAEVAKRRRELEEGPF
jgi:hypothetical protein